MQRGPSSRLTRACSPARVCLPVRGCRLARKDDVAGVAVESERQGSHLGAHHIVAQVGGQ